MARAKRTDRAEARRKYRAYLQAQAEAEGVDDGEDAVVSQTGSKAGRTAAAPVLKPGERVGMVAAFKLAMRPVHYIDDLRYAPTLITRTNAIWIPALLSIAALAYGLTRTDYNDGSVSFILSFALAMPPLIQPMIAGFLAPRATWLAGLISSVISGICLLILFVWYNEGHLANLPAIARYSSGDYPGLAVYLLFTAVTFGSLLGAAAGWYKRFLTLAGAGGKRSQQRSSAQKPAPRRSTGRR